MWYLIVSIPDLCTITYFYGSLCFELLPQQMSKSKKKYIDLSQLAKKYKKAVLETLSGTFNGLRRVTYVIWAVKLV